MAETPPPSKKDRGAEREGGGGFSNGLSVLMSALGRPIDLCAPHMMSGRRAVVNQCRRDNGWSPLMESCYQRHMGLIRLLTEANADCNASRSDGMTVLAVASRCVAA